ncbi:hypothetical protein K443DRAFT_206166 [Laccaria amethystina LaAM-08-1]|uniref:Uncharacterized protein n=1 Tax=Laccaria amethystina LaAM-08-1 TaxID=1095629 RepID=A0A0C9WMW4_9AGAR|nr:hypothetical protein K443DRAFT_206166 [Laccaria amethystina LaAM-08-1]
MAGKLLQLSSQLTSPISAYKCILVSFPLFPDYTSKGQSTLSSSLSCIVLTLRACLGAPRKPGFDSRTETICAPSRWLFSELSMEQPVDRLGRDFLVCASQC